MVFPSIVIENRSEDLVTYLLGLHFRGQLGGFWRPFWKSLLSPSARQASQWPPWPGVSKWTIRYWQWCCKSVKDRKPRLLSCSPWETAEQSCSSASSVVLYKLFFIARGSQSLSKVLLWENHGEAMDCPKAAASCATNGTDARRMLPICLYLESYRSFLFFYRHCALVFRPV